jgi:uncharacterized membrane protein
MGSYNQFAGASKERLAALSDGIFAVAMTLLVLDLHAPAIEAVASERALARALLALAPRLLVYLLSFMTLGIFWVGQQTQLNRLERSNRELAWYHLAFLLMVTLVPFSTSLMAEFITYRVALLVYWANILLLGVTLMVAWRHADRHGLVSPDGREAISRAVQRRIVVAQSLYAIGAALCVIDTYWSIGFIVLVQLLYVVAPHRGPLSRL